MDEASQVDVSTGGVPVGANFVGQPVGGVTVDRSLRPVALVGTVQHRQVVSVGDLGGGSVCEDGRTQFGSAISAGSIDTGSSSRRTTPARDVDCRQPWSNGIEHMLRRERLKTEIDIFKM
ncbi:MAG: hypothetical protein R2710_01865 [Acidimicrobiales bacterium]